MQTNEKWTNKRAKYKMKKDAERRKTLEKEKTQNQFKSIYKL